MFVVVLTGVYMYKNLTILCVSVCVCLLQVRLKSPSSKPVKYKVFLFGGGAHLFSLPGGSTVTIPPKYVFYLENENRYTLLVKVACIHTV